MEFGVEGFIQRPWALLNACTTASTARCKQDHIDVGQFLLHLIYVSSTRWYTKRSIISTWGSCHVMLLSKGKSSIVLSNRSRDEDRKRTHDNDGYRGPLESGTVPARFPQVFK